MELTAKILLREFITQIRRRGVQIYGNSSGLKEQIEISRILSWRVLSMSLDYVADNYISRIAEVTLSRANIRRIVPVDWEELSGTAIRHCAVESFNGISARLLLLDTDEHEMRMRFDLMLEG